MKRLFLLAFLAVSARAAGPAAPQLIKLEKELTTEQEAQKSGAVGTEQYQLFLKEFRTEFEKTFSATPPSSENEALHARVLVLLGDHKEAVAGLQEALKKNPDDPTLRVSLGRTHLDQKDYAGAVAEANAVLEKDPNNQDAKALLAESRGRVAPTSTGRFTAVGQSGQAAQAVGTPKRPDVTYTSTPKHAPILTEVPISESEQHKSRNERPLPLWPLAIPLSGAMIGYGIYKGQQTTTWGENAELDKPIGQTDEQAAAFRHKVKVAGASILIATTVVFVGKRAIPPALELFRRAAASLQNVSASQAGKIQGEAAAEEAATLKQLPWTSWGNYAKTNFQGKQYAQIGERLYTEHAVERMMPSGLSTYGRSISPTFVDEVIKTGQKYPVVVDGVSRIIHRSGNIEIITEQNELIVVTVKHVGSK